MLPDSELNALRADMEALLTDTVMVQRATVSSDGAGGQTVTWSTVAQVPGMLSPARLLPQEGVVADRVAIAQMWKLSVPWGTDIRTGDRAVIGGRTFEVLGLVSGTMAFLLQMTVVEIT